MTEPYKVVVSNRAAKMLTAHAVFLAKCSVLGAQEFKADFERAAQSLTHLPKRNPILKSEVLPNSKYHKLIFSKRYLLVYQIKEDTVFVEYVIDCRQNYGWLIK